MSFSFLPPPTLWRACGAAQVLALASQRSLPCPRQSQQTSMVRVLRRPLSAFQLRAAIGPSCFAFGSDWMYSPASRSVMSSRPSGKAMGIWKRSDQDTRPLTKKNSVNPTNIGAGSVIANPVRSNPRSWCRPQSRREDPGRYHRPACCKWGRACLARRNRMQSGLPKAVQDELHRPTCSRRYANTSSSISHRFDVHFVPIEVRPNVARRG
jgi:hypothetical protein